MKSTALHFILAAIIILNSQIICLGVSLRGGTALLAKNPNEFFSNQTTIYGDAYADGSSINSEKMCNAVIDLYAIFGNKTITQFDSCPKSYELLGQANPEFNGSLPQCYSNIRDIYCGFELIRDDDISIPLALFDFIVGNIITCVKHSSTAARRSLCPGLNTALELVTDADDFCLHLEKKSDVELEKDDYRTVYKYVPETQYDECRHIVESLNYCIYIKQKMGADSFKDCYDKYYEFHNQKRVKLYNSEMRQICSNVILPTFIFYARRFEMLDPRNTYNFCNSILEKNAVAIQNRIDVSDDSANVTSMQTRITRLGEFVHKLVNTSGYIANVQKVFQEFYGNITKNNTRSFQVSNLVKANIDLLNDTLVKMVAYSFVFMENVTKINDQANGIYSRIDTVAQQMNQVLQLFNITYELSLFLTNALNGNFPQNALNNDYPETHIDYNGNFKMFQDYLNDWMLVTTPVQKDYLVKLNNIFFKCKENIQSAITIMNTLDGDEVKKYQELIKKYSQEEGQYDQILNNLLSQQSINQDSASSII